MEPLAPHPPLAFDEHGKPFSTLYGDVFRSRDGARAEAREVFVEGCDLPARWRAAERPAAPVAHPFTVLELGFGAAVNFLETLAAWRSVAPRGLRLHFVTVEAHPLARDDVERAHRALGIDGDDAKRLRDRWPRALPGLHTIAFDDANAVLTVCLGSAERVVPRLRLAADAIYLDGFAPARNPAMWQAPLMRALARLARAQATLATWSAASAVRRALHEAGFEVERLAGHGGKRHRLRARYAPRWRTFPAPDAPPQWPSTDVLVVGAGLAGAATAAGFAHRGWRVQVLEARDAPACGGSGQPLCADHLHLSPDDNVLARLTRSALGFRDAFAPPREQPMGKLLLDADEAQATHRIEMLRRLAFPEAFVRHVAQDEASELSGVALARGALWLADAHIVDPRALVDRWLAHDAIELRTGTRVERLACDETGWSAFDAAGTRIARAALVVLANASDALRLGGLASLPLRAMRGQSTWLPKASLPGLRRAVSGLAYAAPAGERILVGASFDDGDSLEPSPRADASNVRRLAAMLAPDAAAAGTSADAWARHARCAAVGVRWASIDRIAAIGELPDEPHAWRQAQCLVGNERLALPRASGLYGAFGCGTRGVVWACLAAQLLPALADGSPAPIEADLMRALDPARFVRRRLRAAVR